MLGQLPIWEIPLSENSRTKTIERHSNLTVTLEQASPSKMTSTPRDVKGKSRSKDWRIRYLPETDDISPEALSSLKCPFDTIPNQKIAYLRNSPKMYNTCLAVKKLGHPIQATMLDSTTHWYLSATSTAYGLKYVSEETNLNAFD